MIYSIFQLDEQNMLKRKQSHRFLLILHITDNLQLKHLLSSKNLQLTYIINLITQFYHQSNNIPLLSSNLYRYHQTYNIYHQTYNKPLSSNL